MQTQIKMNYKTEKLMKKLYGKNLAFQISSGRKLRKILGKSWQKEKESKI